MKATTEATQPVPEVDQVLARLRQMNGESIALSRQDAGWLLAEIDGGREAFGAVVQQKKGLPCSSAHAHNVTRSKQG